MSGWPGDGDALRAALGLDAAGFNVHGVLEPQTWDARVPPAWQCSALLPGARSALVLGAGARALFRAFERAPEFGCEPDPLDAYTRRVVEAAVDRLGERDVRASAVWANEPLGGRFADFVALGRACGLGAPSRLGLLLHPVYGPWVSLRAAVLCDLPLAPTPALDGFDPCPGCPAPCASACHGSAVAPGGFDVAACAATRRREPACARRCDARRACVVGPEHAYDPGAEAHHMARGGA